VPHASLRRRASFALAGLAAAALALAGAARAGEPSVPYVPTPQEVVERMLSLAKVTASDYVIDLGSGDGRIVITAAKKFGARGFGVDIDPQRVAESNENARKAGVADRVTFYQRDLFETDLGEATVITMYLLPRVNLALRPRLLELKPGTRIVSHDFSMEDWQPDAHVVVDAKDKYGGAGGRSDVYLWIVPAKVGGDWRWQLATRGKARAYELRLEQKFQKISGSVRVDGRNAKLEGAQLRGDEIRFRFTVELEGEPVRHDFRGKVRDGAIFGSAQLDGPRLRGQFEWEAVRTERAAAAAARRTAPSARARG
jgi:hypothetical protein